MNALEALEAMKNGLSVVAFEKGEHIAAELFKYVAKDTVEIYLPDSYDRPTDILSPAKFLKSYDDAEFEAYNINLKE